MGIQVFFWAGKFPIFHSQSWAGKLPVGQVRQKNFAPSWARKTCDTVFCTDYVSRIFDIFSLNFHFINQVTYVDMGRQ